MSNIDENREYVMLAEDPNGLAMPVKVTANGEILIEFVMNGSFSSSTAPKIDDNRTYVSLAENPSNAIFPLNTDSNGYLIIDTTNLIVS